ncbi:T9SS type B sorting domain-containing protein [Flavobacterium rhizosphaerae]|uniref:T9SS type B sorting domain-containing protein n=1 Tax=Flavobacterium rhizosphaerae TaxID=3163298 RepID=A0ABW8Z2Q2_9FLAO
MKKITFVLALLFNIALNAQLSNFTLSVTKTDESCQGNGSLTFLVSNTTPNASLLYKVYLLPDTSTAIAITQENYVGGLGAGTYKVVAIQSLGNELATKEKNVTIVEDITSFNFNVSTQNQPCSLTGTLVVEATSGTAVSYEIIGGPETRPLQASNVFSGLGQGTYKVRAFDACGVGKVRSHTLSIVTTDLNISDPIFPDEISPECDSITVNNVITASSGSITYPVAVQHVISTLDIGGDPIIINQVFNTGDENALTVSAIMPRYMDQLYTYDISVTDNCSTVYEKFDNVVDPSIILELSDQEAPCAEKFLELSAYKFTDSYTVEFLSAPADFNPADFNATPAGPFTEVSTTYGSEQNPMPFGDYVVKITDACGRTATESISLIFVKPTPNARGFNNGCFSLFGKINISVPEQDIVSATLIEAPEAYTSVMAIPQDLTAFLLGNPKKIVMPDMPLGEYTIQFTDDCGFEYEVTVEVPPFVEKDFNLSTLPGCAVGFGTIRLRSGNGPLEEVYITSAPAAFGQSLPYNVTGLLTNNGQLYLGDLPGGRYTFNATDYCGIEKDMTVDVDGYQPDSNSFEFIPRCGGFAVDMHDNSNGLQGAKFWLQKYYPQSDSWGHPNNPNNLYEEGSIPTNSNGRSLNNNAIRNNLNFTGRFRIIKKFDTFSTGTSEVTECVSVLGEFEYRDVLTINTAYTLACIGNPDDVLIEATGQPTSFTIIEKDGQPYSFDNGSDNVFHNIEPAEYVFRIEDDCGNVVTQWFNVRELPSIADATQPKDLIICVEEGETAGNVYHLTDQNDSVLGPLHSSMYTITYHLTYEDADTGENPLPEYYTALSNGQTIYVRLVHNEIQICHGITSFQLFIGEYEQPVITTTGTICNEGSVAVTAEGNFDTYMWSTGETTRTIYVTEPGVYAVIGGRSYGTASCDGYEEVIINQSATPEITKIETKDWTRDQNMIIVHVKGNSSYEYSLDGITYQTSNVFTGLETGVYQVYVKDAYGCGEDIKEIALLNYPNYFTPNGDGIHDTWYIKYAALEPHIEINIFDRYGKFITTFGSTSKGWDGTLNGIQLPSTDYWFVVTREDGTQHRGHFAMVR